MGLDFDLQTFCTNLKATKPPYECPYAGCGKVYKSYSGIHFHLLHHDDQDGSSTPNKNKQKRGGRKGASTPGRRRSPSPSDFPSSPKQQLETLSYAEAQRMVEIELDGRIRRLNIFEPLEIISQDEIDNCDNTEKESKEEKSFLHEAPQKTPNKSKESKKGKDSKGKKNGSSAVVSVNNNNNTPGPVKLPEAVFTILEDWVKPPSCSKRSSAYYRFMEKTTDELDEDVEYDMDEEDYAWLDLLNEQRKKDNMSAVQQETFELLMDRFEKEAFFQSQSSGKDLAPPIDEDAVCSICMDGECQNSNVILFCDMCNLPVHQECYGVPYIPEGQWLCRRCLQSPSRAVDCCLCPNKGGAFKQTDDSRWSHVVCALWIPEVGFANTVFLEPIDCLERIPAARWKLTCYICKQRGTGACIQCHKTNCYTAFHVTCAQQAGLFMKIEPVREPSGTGLTVSVRKTAFCDVHTPPNTNFLPMIDNGIDSDDENRPKNQLSPADFKAKARLKMRRARKILAEKRNAVPIVSIPIIPDKRLTKISSKVKLQKKEQFIGRLQSYWTLKRQSRNGVPLLRRLQSSHMSKNKTDQKTEQQNNALKEQLKYWQRLRQDLEKARLLVELIRKREKLKREQLRLHQMATEMELTPFLMILRHTLDQLQEKDPQGIFAEPVDLDEVPDYVNHITTPMDFSTMRKKMEGHQYRTMTDFETDFDLIIHNCMSYNAKDTSFYRAATKLRDQGGAVIRAAKRMADRVGFDPDTGLLTAETPIIEPNVDILDDIEEVLSGKNRRQLPLEKQLQILLDRLDAATQSSRPGRKTRIERRLKSEIFKVRRQLARQKGQNFMSDMEDGNTSVNTASDDDEEDSKPALPEPPPPPPPTKEKKKGGRGGGRRGRTATAAATAAAVAASQEAVEAEEVKEIKEPAKRTVTPPKEEKPAEPPATPSGVNRRTAVLFSKKARKHEANTSTPTPASTSGRTGKTGGGRGRRKSAAMRESVDNAGCGDKKVEGVVGGPVLDEEDEEEEVVKEKMVVAVIGKDVEEVVKEEDNKEGTSSSSVKAAEAPTEDADPDMDPPPAKRIALDEEALAAQAAATTTEKSSASTSGAPPSFVPPPKESFTMYRNLNQQYESEIDSTSECGSTATSGTETGAAGSSSDELSEDGTPKPKKKNSPPVLSPIIQQEPPSTPKTTTKRRGGGGAGRLQMPPTPQTPQTPKQKQRKRKLPATPSADQPTILDFVNKSKQAATPTTPSRVAAARPGIGVMANGPSMGKAGEGLILDDEEEEGSIANNGERTVDRVSTGLVMVVVDENNAAPPTDQLPPCSPYSSSCSTTSARSKRAIKDQIEWMTQRFVAHSRYYGPHLSKIQSQDLTVVADNNTNNNDDDDDGAAGRRASSWCSDSLEQVPLEPLDLVWAKCQGYPWYPALIINPKMPKTGYLHNGVPIPVPPEDVLQIMPNFEDNQMYLVLFFDAKRTWQWLPRMKLEPLGVDSGLDKNKLMENKKPNVKKAVKKAYEKAVLHRCRVTGEPNPLAPDFCNDD